jgi:hypothetical protein
MPRKYVRTIDDYPDTEILIQHLNNRYEIPTKTGADMLKSFSVGRSGKYYHFSRRILAGVTGNSWASWDPTISQIKQLIYILTCPMSDLPKYAVQEPDDYNITTLKFVGQVKIPSIKEIIREIAINRLEGKL